MARQELCSERLPNDQGPEAQQEAEKNVGSGMPEREATVQF